MQRFLVGARTRRTHEIIPVLGYWSKPTSRPYLTSHAPVASPKSVIGRYLHGSHSLAIMLGLVAIVAASVTSTRRNRGGDHVPYCTPPDAVEPAPRRLSNPAGRAGSHRFQQQPS